MGKTKQIESTVKVQQSAPVKLSVYKPIPKFNTKCKNC